MDKNGKWIRYCQKMFSNFLNNYNLKKNSRNTSIGDVFAIKFNSSIRDLPNEPVLEKCEANWIDVLATIMKQYNNTKHSSTKTAPIRAA